MIILIIVMVTCTWGRHYQVRSVDSMIEILNEIEAASDNEKQQLAKNLDAMFAASADILACYMNHDDVESARDAIVTLCAAVHHHGEAEILSATESARAQLVKLRNIDSVRLENVL